jgi:transposase
MSAHSLSFWTDLLHLTDYEVVFCQEEADFPRYRFTIAPKVHAALCPHCGKATDSIHQTRSRDRIKDLPLGNFAVELTVRIHQFECLRCGQLFTPAVPFLAAGPHATQRFLERASQLVRTSDLANAAQFLGVPERTLANWYYDYLQHRSRPDGQKIKPIKHLGIDELARKKKGEKYVAVIVDHDNDRVLEVLPNREKSTVLAYLKQGKQGLLAHVEEVTTDMWDGYVEAVKEVFGDQAAITIDRFHVMKNFQECLTKARRELQKTLSPQERQELKGSRWLLLTNWENLSAEEQEKLKQLKAKVPSLGRLVDQREALRAIFEDRSITRPEEGKKRLQGWMEQVQRMGLQALGSFCKTLGNWMDKITNYFLNRGSNGRTEGLNRGVRGLLWRAFGMANFENFRMRVLHCFGLKLT